MSTHFRVIAQFNSDLLIACFGFDLISKDCKASYMNVAVGVKTEKSFRVRRLPKYHYSTSACRIKSKKFQLDHQYNFRV